MRRVYQFRQWGFKLHIHKEDSVFNKILDAWENIAGLIVGLFWIALILVLIPGLLGKMAGF